jgi:hypothetical protein
MTRASVLLPLAVLAAGCQSSLDPCDPTLLKVYWTPGSPNAGFQVPGLVAAGLPAQLGCAAAGVDGVQLRVGGSLIPCSGGVCLGPNTWLCSARGLSIPLSDGGTYEVQAEAFDLAGNLKYTSGPVAAVASRCGVSEVGVFSQGVAGTLGIDYTFADATNCQQPASDIVWDLRSGLSTPFDAGSIPCGTTNPFLVSGGLSVEPGVYTLDAITEESTSVRHALCLTTFVHAGSDTLAVALPVPTQTCP